MRFGTSTWFFQEYSVLEALEKIARAGFTAAEVWMEHLLNTGENTALVAGQAERLGLALSLHGASYDINWGSINPGIRRESLHQVEESIAAAARIGAEVVVLHPGRLSASKANLEEYWQVMEENFVLINELARGEGIKAGIEAMEKRAKEMYILPRDVRRMLDKGWSNLGLTLDLAHANTVMDPAEYIHSLDRRWIVHAHLSDGSREATHLPLGRGEIDIVGALRALEKVYDGLVIIEGYIPGEGEKIIASNRDYLKQAGWMR